jgi:hypothetical protein
VRFTHYNKCDDIIEPFKEKGVFTKMDGDSHRHTICLLCERGNEIAPEVKTMEGITGASVNGMAPLVLEYQVPAAIILEASTVPTKIRAELQDLILDPPASIENNAEQKFSPQARRNARRALIYSNVKPQVTIEERALSQRRAASSQKRPTLTRQVFQK